MHRNLIPAYENPNPSGLCRCGCGEPAPIATETHRDRDEIKGFPRRYVPGHKSGPDRRPLADRFWEMVEKSGGCWLWTGSTGSGGHGKISEGGQRGRDLCAHRVSWEIHNGPIPDGMWVLHDCPGGDNPACVNPAHLYLGTVRDNFADMVKKGRSARGERSGTAKLMDCDVECIRKLAAMGMRQVEITDIFSVSRSTICDVVNGKRY